MIKKIFLLLLVVILVGCEAVPRSQNANQGEESAGGQSADEGVIGDSGVNSANFEKSEKENSDISETKEKEDLENKEKSEQGSDANSSESGQELKKLDSKTYPAETKGWMVFESMTPGLKFKFEYPEEMEVKEKIGTESFSSILKPVLSLILPTWDKNIYAPSSISLYSSENSTADLETWFLENVFLDRQGYSETRGNQTVDYYVLDNLNYPAIEQKYCYDLQGIAGVGGYPSCHIFRYLKVSDELVISFSTQTTFEYFPEESKKIVEYFERVVPSFTML